jgi:hypothetical protein
MRLSVIFAEQEKSQERGKLGVSGGYQENTLVQTRQFPMMTKSKATNRNTNILHISL